MLPIVVRQFHSKFKWSHTFSRGFFLGLSWLKSLSWHFLNWFRCFLKYLLPQHFPFLSIFIFIYIFLPLVFSKYFSSLWSNTKLSVWRVKLEQNGNFDVKSHKWCDDFKINGEKKKTATILYSWSAITQCHKKRGRPKNGEDF